jgi:NADPH:quinone reductase-like Zn-dependent oxidoreductase
MKAVIWTKYGPPEVLQLREVEKPVPKETEVRVRIHATSVTAADCQLRSLKGPLYLSLPMRLFVGFGEPKRITVLGQELAGEIESVGRDVRLFREGDQVFAFTGLSLGAYAEYKCLPEGGTLAIKPSNMTYEEAAVLPLGGLEAAYFMRQGNIQGGEKVLINGAGGSIGSFAVQLARCFGAEVTAVDSTAKLDMLRSIGADRVIDYTREDITKHGESYDVMLDTVGTISYSSSIGLLKPHGRYLLANPQPSHMIRRRWTSPGNDKKVLFWSDSQRTQDILFLKELIEAGKVKSVIDRTYPLEQIAEAHRYVDSGQKKGNVAITVAHQP